MMTKLECGEWDPQGKDWIIGCRGVDADVTCGLNADGLIHDRDLYFHDAIEYLLKGIANDPRDLAPKSPTQSLLLRVER